MKPAARQAIDRQATVSWEARVTLRVASLLPISIGIDREAAKAYVCAVAIWFWDRGRGDVLDDIVHAALDGGVKCPPAFGRIYSDIRAGRRPVPAQRGPKLKAQSGSLLYSICSMTAIRAACRAAFEDPTGQISLQPDLEPREARRLSRAFEKRWRQTQADNAGISLAVLERSEREFRKLVLEMSKDH